VYIPSTDAGSVTENGLLLNAAKDITPGGTENDFVVVKIGSGKYHFEAKQ